MSIPIWLSEHIQPFDEHTSCLYAALKQFLYIGCIKWLAFGNQRLIGRLNGKQQILQSPINLHCLTVLAVHPALTGIPQIGVAGEFTTKLGNGTPNGNTSHNRNFPRLVQTALFKVEQHFHLFFSIRFNICGQRQCKRVP